MKITEIGTADKKTIETIVDIHMRTFKGFFLTFMGKGFLKSMYSSYCNHECSGILAAVDDDDKIIGFLAFSGDMSGLYKHMIKSKLFSFAFYSIGAFFRKPRVFMRLVRAFLKPSEAKREEKYVELASIGVDPERKSKGVGSLLTDALKERVDFSQYSYITLETDAENNEAANKFYLKNGFVLERTYETKEGRKMNEYRFGGKAE